MIGFEVGEIDLMIGELNAGEDDGLEEEPAVEAIAVSRVDDVWNLGKNRIVCGDSTYPATFATLMSGVSKAAFVFSDPPFGCGIDGFVATAGRHREFVMASGDMAPDELAAFLASFIRRCCCTSRRAPWSSW